MTNAIQLHSLDAGFRAPHAEIRRFFQRAMIFLMNATWMKMTKIMRWKAHKNVNVIKISESALIHPVQLRARRAAIQMLVNSRVWMDYANSRIQTEVEFPLSNLLQSLSQWSSAKYVNVMGERNTRYLGCVCSALSGEHTWWPGWKKNTLCNCWLRQ